MQSTGYVTFRKALLVFICLLSSPCVPTLKAFESEANPKKSNSTPKMSSSKRATDDSTVPSAVLRVLALHGAGDNGPEFQQRYEPLLQQAFNRSNLRIEMTSVTAPIPYGDGGYAWWPLPPGKRSHTVDIYRDFDTTQNSVLDALNDADPPYDIVLGHSQGGIICTALLALDRIQRHPRMGYVLAGVAMPNPYRLQVENLSSRRAIDRAPDDARILFVHGKNDYVTDLKYGNEIYQAFNKANWKAAQLVHEGGHEVPAWDDTAMDSIVGWIKDAIESKQECKSNL